MHKTRFFFAILAVILIAAPAFLSAEQPATGYIDTQSADWQDYWEPCFQARPGDRIVAMRGLNAMIKLFEEMADAGKALLALQGDATRSEWTMEDEIPEEYIEIMVGAKMTQALDDFEMVANHGCGAAQAAMGEFKGRNFGGQAERLEALEWMLLAEKSGYAPVQEALKREMSFHDSEEIAEARAWVDAWRPSD